MTEEKILNLIRTLEPNNTKLAMSLIKGLGIEIDDNIVEDAIYDGVFESININKTVNKIKTPLPSLFHSFILLSFNALDFNYTSEGKYISRKGAIRVSVLYDDGSDATIPMDLCSIDMCGVTYHINYFDNSINFTIDTTIHPTAIIRSSYTELKAELFNLKDHPKKWKYKEGVKQLIRYTFDVLLKEKHGTIQFLKRANQ